MNTPWKWAGTFVLAVLISPAHAGMLDGLGQESRDTSPTAWEDRPTT